MEKSTSIKEIGKALISFHLKVDTVKKDATNPFFKSKYASLSNILEAIQIPLEERFQFLHGAIKSNEAIAYYTALAHFNSFMVRIKSHLLEWYFQNHKQFQFLHGAIKRCLA